MNKKKLSKTKTHYPLVSIITPTLNQGEFIEDCIKSIELQTYKNIEHIVIDGKSTDDTIKILKKHPKIRWISEKDAGYWDALNKGMKMAKGKYVMVCMASDGYVNKKWVDQCVEVLESDPEISMVWGLPQWLEDGKLTDICYAHFHNKKVPQKYDWLAYWLMTGECLPNGNFCFHKKVFDICNTSDKNTPKGRELYDLNYNFNTKGYLPYHIPVVAEFGRAHTGQLSQSWTQGGWYAKAVNRYNQLIEEYIVALQKNKKKHIYRDSTGNALTKKFDVREINRIQAKYLRAKILFYLLLQRGPRKLKQRLKIYASQYVKI